MSYWDSKNLKVVRFPPEQWSKDYPLWDRIDCECCAGIKCGGASPEECDRCKGNGMLASHFSSGVIALYPGGPFA